MFTLFVRQFNRVTTKSFFDLSPILLDVKTMSTDTVTVEASAKQTATIIFLHGLGDTGKGWSSTIAQIKPAFAKSICPTAQVMPVTLNCGFPMPSWFDLFALEADGRVDEEGIKKAKTLIHQLIANEEKAGIAANRIILGGFSQGGALALYAGLTYPKPIAGIICLSCWLPKHEMVIQQLNNNKDIPVLQCHGDSDPIVQLLWGQMTAQQLSKAMTKYEFKTYKGMAHSSCEEELVDAKTFINKCLSNN